MRITVDGTPKDLPAPTTVADLMEGLGHGPEAPVAVAVNGTFVPRSTWAARSLAEGDAVEIVAPAQGG
ncbi:MAG TPA: thiamine biosynthesis protein ThiS [Rhodospirillaceae bacterium]|jgi:sulfur carrier protein|nr:sulfur carrier protein ThiS [Alphaproteobacteria bacterium]HBH26442.1 thiamine biosynthesis protein ThiS [Rhodospirillaceae bacterium]